MPKTCGECPHHDVCDVADPLAFECPARTRERQSEAALQVARDVYEKFKHLGHLLADREWCGEDFRFNMLYDLWQAITKINEVSDE